MATWLVTGAGRGIGLELVRQVHARGDDVIATCRTVSPELDDVGCGVVAGIDVARDGVAETLDAALADQAIDVLVNNAAAARWATLETLDLDDVREELEVNTLGPLRVTLAALPRLGEGGKVAFVSSRAGSIGDRPSGGNYGYRISKAGLNMAGANLAHDLAPRGIHVVLLHPGFVRTDMTGGGGTVDPPEAAAGLVEQIDLLDASRSGRFFHANGGEIPW
jgi:NAD(P)-dependent dehydrogenase (short-subunit alcohol dehydrogenase family)